MNNIRSLYCFLMLLLSFSAVAVPTDYLVLKWSKQLGLVSEFHQVVELTNNPYLLDEKPEKLAVKLMGKDGTEKWLPIEKSQFTRAEFHGEGSVDGRQILNEEVVFVVRVEKNWVDQLILPARLAQKSMQSYSWNILLASASNTGTQLVSEKLSERKSNQDNRVNLLFMGDGYTGAQQTDYNHDVDEVIAYMQTFEPYLSYKNFLSYDRLFVASNQSGADKPAPCFNPAVSRDTAFDGKYCTNGIDRLVTVNASKILAAAAASPNWDEIVVIVNDSRYGGSGGYFSTISTNEFAADVFVHEYGHTFTDLADEYDSPYPGYPACSDVNGPICDVNVTDETNRNAIKWSYLIEPSTPIPTPETSLYDGVVGLFEGARYQEFNMYRSQNKCNMQSLGAAFCKVCQEAYVLKLYSVNYSGGQLLSLIEPNSMVPSQSNMTGMVAVSMNFSVDTMQPNHGLSVTWLVNDVPHSVEINTDNQQSFQLIPNQVGLSSIKVRIKDNSPFVHLTRIDELPEFEFEWVVDVLPFEDLIFAAGFE